MSLSLSLTLAVLKKKKEKTEENETKVCVAAAGFVPNNNRFPLALLRERTRRHIKEKRERKGLLSSNSAAAAAAGTLEMGKQKLDNDHRIIRSGMERERERKWRANCE